MFKKISFAKLMMGFYALILFSLFVDVYIVHAKEYPCVAPVVGLTQTRAESASTAAVLTSDGHMWNVPNPYDDTFPGDLWFCVRDDRGTSDPVDDDIAVIGYIGYEVWVPDYQLYQWYIWDSTLCQYVVTCATY